MINKMWRLTDKWRLALVTVAAGAAFVALVAGGALHEEDAGVVVTVSSGQNNGSGTNDTPWD